MIKAMSKSIWHIGVIEKGKRYFWKMVFRSLLHKPKLFAEEITQSVYGYHYRTVLIGKNNE